MIEKFKLKNAYNAILYIVREIGETDITRILYLMYFADKYSLINYARTITNDTYFALNGVFGIGTCRILFNITDTEPNMDYLSMSDIKCLEYAIKKYGECSTEELIEKSKGYAYNHTTQGCIVALEDIMKEENCDKEYIEYVIELEHIQKSLL